MLNERPIFVIGAQRSGTTLLRYILSSHPRIYIPPESNFIPRYFGSEPRGTFSRNQSIEIMKGIQNYRTFFKDWKHERPDPVTLVDSLQYLTPANLLNTLYIQYASYYDAQRWGDKSPIYSDYVELINEIFPQAQFIHIIRDGRDVVLSMLKSYQTIRFFYFDIYYAARIWKERVNKARIAGNRIGPEKYYEVRYEDLTSSPANEIRNICQYLGEDFFENMTAPYSTAADFHHSIGIHSGTRKPLNTGSVGKWKTSMSLKDQRVFNSIAGVLLADLGYELHKLGGKTISEVIRYGRLKLKYYSVKLVKKLIRSGGLFHPTEILSKYFEPYPKNSPQ